MSREQFIDKYTELQQTSEKKESSIFSDKISGSIGQIFDMLNTDGNETLDENELLALKALDNSDGGNVLSDSDLNVIYDKLSKKIIEDFDNNTEENTRIVQNSLVKIAQKWYYTFVLNMNWGINAPKTNKEGL